MANAEQLERLKQGIDVWNNWRRNNANVRVDLSGADLRGASLKSANLSEADLSGADLSGAILEFADLLLANLTEAKLRRANLQFVYLGMAVLRRADLRQSNLRHANLSDADLSGADLRSAVLVGAALYGVDLTQADVSGADLRGARFKKPVVVRQGTPRAGAARSSEGSAWERTPSGEEFLGPLDAGGMENAAPPTGSEPAPPQDVSFTSIYPKEAPVETWQTLLVYAHVPSALDDLRRDAERVAWPIPAPKEISVSTRLARGTELTIVPSCEAVTFNPERLTLKWLENYQRAEFRFRAEASLAEDAARGRIHVYAGPLLVGTLPFAMLFSLSGPRVSPLQEAHGRIYRQEDIFISYSRKDTAVVKACQKAYQALGFNVLIDVDTLRAGQRWNEELMDMIDRASIFQLFWSHNSGASPYCRQEWEHALKKNREGFIRPVYWERPMHPPPEELREYHFEFMELEGEDK